MTSHGISCGYTEVASGYLGYEPPYIKLATYQTPGEILRLSNFWIRSHVSSFLSVALTAESVKMAEGHFVSRALTNIKPNK
jgi:hypothetical protein